MYLSQNDEIVESSQQSNRCSQRGRKKRTNATQWGTRKSLRLTAQPESLPVFEFSDNSTEDHSVNISGSLFDGQNDLLQHYDEHEKIQNESVKKVSAVGVDVPGCQGDGVAVDKRDKHDIGCKTVSMNSQHQMNQQDAETQTHNPELRNVHVQLSPIAPKRAIRDASVQMSPESRTKRARTSVAVNTEPIAYRNGSAQTLQLETREVAVQKYHSTRVSEVSVQTSRCELPRNVAKRNVCIQHRSCDVLELGEGNAIGLGIEFKCDPRRLHRAMLKLAMQQNCGSDTSSRSVMVEFTEEDPYCANYSYFMDDCAEQVNVTVNTDSGVFDEEVIANYYSIESFR
ncbi:uncharacterized protein LOC129771118 [Toxorhynchites rutilus septentrionalis]|uniref:uncharacterized protein LOC129771118 n=1 Tax=Toxorhynchites rutilus septentrionalis TaxID=329112 RepID=UPI002478C46D|nr:uncharacterized protein LOC129771118 [Toxorhynchites rutilus septentrionalis]